MIVLGLETSCDETSAALVTDKREILSNVIVSQLEEHRPYAGVVPEIAARAHSDYLEPVITKAIKEAGIGWNDIDAIAATAGPGLIGGVMIGLTAAKGLSVALNKPFIGVNHLEGHALTARLVYNTQFPYLLLLISGGHTQIILVSDVGKYRLLGSSIDDAAGEAFDKSAKMLGLGYPGGPAMEKCAEQFKSTGKKSKFPLPRPLKGREGCDFSFSGLKTAVRHHALEGENSLNETEKSEIAFEFHSAVADVFDDRLENAFKILAKEKIGLKSLVVAGGVAANKYLGSRFREKASAHGIEFHAPPMRLCTDNAAMIAWAGVERFSRGETSDLSMKARPRWPLIELTPPVGTGKD